MWWVRLQQIRRPISGGLGPNYLTTKDTQYHIHVTYDILAYYLHQMISFFLFPSQVPAQHILLLLLKLNIN